MFDPTYEIDRCIEIGSKYDVNQFHHPILSPNLRLFPAYLREKEKQECLSGGTEIKYRNSERC